MRVRCWLSVFCSAVGCAKQRSSSAMFYHFPPQNFTQSRNDPCAAKDRARLEGRVRYDFAPIGPIDPHMVPYKPLWGRWTQTVPDGPRWAQMGPYKPNDGFDCKSNSSIVWIPAVLKFQSDDRYAINCRWILVSISDSLMKRFKWHTAVCSSNLPRVRWYIMP